MKKFTARMYRSGLPCAENDFFDPHDVKNVIEARSFNAPT